MDIQYIIHQSYHILRTNEFYNCRINEIPSKRNEDEIMGYQILATDVKDNKAIFYVTINIPILKNIMNFQVMILILMIIFLMI